jgi:phosphomannomutase
MLPILCALFAAEESGVSLCDLLEGVCTRFSRAALLPNFPRSASLRMIEKLSPSNRNIGQLVFDPEGIVALNCGCGEVQLSTQEREELQHLHTAVSYFFSPDHGFAPPARIDYTDGVRITFRNGEVAHVRPSGNADELRIYAAADSQQRADEIARLGTEPGGILHRMGSALL